MKYLFQLLVLTGFCVSCSEQSKHQVVLTKSDVSKTANPLAWIDTVRFNTPLTEEQSRQVYFVRNNEEDLRKLTDTARVILRFSWWRAFHPAVNARVENRPQIRDSSGVRRLYQEWFALCKENIQRLNDHCPVEIDGKCSGQQLTHLYQQHVVLLPVNQQPKILAELNDAGFWQMDSANFDTPHTDGSSWNLEVYYKGKYKSVTTDKQQHPIKKLCLEILKLSEYPIKKEEIY